MTFPKKAMRAIQKGIAQNATIAELEYLGVNLRVLNQIEDCCGIIYLADLLKLTDKDILNIPNLGEKGLASIKQALFIYHKLESSKKRWHNSGSSKLEYYKKNSKRLEGALS